MQLMRFDRRIQVFSLLEPGVFLSGPRLPF
jgi:hypothetical protein